MKAPFDKFSNSAFAMIIGFCFYSLSENTDIQMFMSVVYKKVSLPIQREQLASSAMTAHKDHPTKSEAPILTHTTREKC